MSKNNNKLLYFGPSGIGDWCVIYPSLEAICTELNLDSVDVVLPYKNPGNMTLIYTDLIDNIYYLNRPKKISDLPNYVVNVTSLFFKLKNRKYTALYVSFLSNQIDFLLITKGLNIISKVGCNTHNLVKRINPFTKYVSFEAHLDKLAQHNKYSGFPKTLNTLFQSFPWTKKATLEKFSLRENEYFVFGIGGGKDAEWRFWPASNYSQLAKLLSPSKVILLGGGADDYNAGIKIIGKNILNLINKTSFNEALNLVLAAKAVIGNDSGITNISAALKNKTVTIYGPSSHRLTGPALIGSTFVQSHISCSPCFGTDQDKSFAEKCPHKNCLVYLSANDIYNSINKAKFTS
jgi:ADP-heptose:LPS heptosyltransferase